MNHQFGDKIPELMKLILQYNRTAPHGGVIVALKIVKNTGIYSVLWPT